MQGWNGMERDKERAREGEGEPCPSLSTPRWAGHARPRPATHPLSPTASCQALTDCCTKRAHSLSLSLSPNPFTLFQRRRRASRSDSSRVRMSPSRTGPLTLRMINRFWSSRNLTRTWVTCERRAEGRRDERRLSEEVGRSECLFRVRNGRPSLRLRASRLPGQHCRLALACVPQGPGGRGARPGRRDGAAREALARAAAATLVSFSLPSLTWPREPVRPMTFMTMASLMGES